MKIILVGNTAWSMYNFRCQVIRSFIEKGRDVIVVAPEDDVYEKKLEAIGVKFININLNRKGTNLIEELRLFQSLRKIIKEERPDYCFFYTIKPNIYGGLAAGLNHVRFTSVVTGLGYVFNTKGLIFKISKMMYKIAFSYAEHVWFLNEQDKKDFVTSRIISEEKGFVLKFGEGIDLTSFTPTKITGNNRSFLLSARMLYEKGVKIYVDAARPLKKKYPEVEWKLLGFIDEGNPEGISAKTIKKWEQEGVVKYLGETEDVRPYINNSTCVVLPSYYREGIPFALLEGSASGRPIITTDNVGCRNVVEDKVSGYLCKTKDVKSLSDVMEKIIEDSNETLNKMGQAGRNKVEREYDVRNVIREYESVLGNS